MSKSCLNNLSTVDIVDIKNEIEGKDYINISYYSNLPIGKMLSQGYGIKIDTIFGTVGSIRNLMEFISKPNYPVSILKKSKLSPYDIKKIPHTTISVPNFWSIVAMGVCLRIKSYPEIMAELKSLDSDIKFTNFKIKQTKDLFNNSVSSVLYSNKAGRYLSILRHIKKMLDTDSFTDENIQKFILDCRDHDNKGIYDNMAVSVITK